MNSAALRRRWTYLGLSLIAALSLYYLYRAITYRFLSPGRLGPELFNKQLWYFSHVAFALPVLFGAPLQFITSLRVRAPQLHRAIGKAYVVGACSAALLAIYLGAIVGEYEGSRLSIALTGLIWIFFTLAAWRLAVAQNVRAHRAFMIRSYTMALVLVWLRLMYDFQEYLFFYVTNEDLRDATREWASWVVPLLIVEMWLNWGPQVRGGKPA
ncbi:MAG: DUF2306 domain-containing protein [Gemmatimonadota bacterium]|nr:DUF2306 domain-containing protein [Gemmatimonadota bacterium]